MQAYSTEVVTSAASVKTSTELFSFGNPTAVEKCGTDMQSCWPTGKAELLKCSVRVCNAVIQSITTEHRFSIQVQCVCTKLFSESEPQGGKFYSSH